MQQSLRTRLFTTTMAAMAIALVSGGVQNTEAAEQARRASAILMEEVLVTGRKKSTAEELQSVPVAITAVSGEQVEAMFATDLTDIGYRAPNVSLNPVSTIPLYANFVIRGFGLNGSVLSDDPSVGVFVDGMYLGIPAGVVTNTFDLEGVEILRGPQGTLFGRNVTGGAILLNTRRPADEFGFRARTIIGNDQNRQYMVSVDAPLIEDKLYSRLTILSSSQGDSHDNVVPRSLGGAGDLGEKDLLVIRPKLRWTPTDNLTITLSGEYGDGETEPGARRFLHDGIAGIINGIAAGEGIPIITSDNSNKIAADFIPEISHTWRHAIAEVFWEFSDKSTLKSITGWRDLEQTNIAQDIDGTGVDFFNFNGGFINQEQWSQEFILTHQYSDAIDLTFGAYYFEQKYNYGEHREIGAVLGLGGAPGVPLDQAGVGEIEHDTSAVFVSADILLKENLILTLGGRMTWESKDVSLARRLTGECAGGVLTACTDGFTGDESWNNFTPKVGIQYNLDEDTQIYASYTKGFRSGGFNIRATSDATTGPYEEEKIDAFEVGIKTDFLDSRGRMNLALFYMEFQDLQRTLLDTTASQQIINVGEGVFFGAELELSYLVGENLLLQGNFGYIESEFDEFTDFDLTGDSVPDPELAKKLEVAHVPHWTNSLSATYDMDVPMGFISLRGTYSYTDDSFADDANTYNISSYELWDASATLTTNDGHWSVSLFGKNLTDEVYFQSVFIFGVIDVADLGPRRSYGLSVTYEY